MDIAHSTGDTAPPMGIRPFQRLGAGPRCGDSRRPPGDPPVCRRAARMGGVTDLPTQPVACRRYRASTNPVGDG